MDTTSLVLAVDSTQVNSASAALQKMAGEGFKAESVVAKLANTAQLQGRAINSGIVRNAAAAADSIKGLTSATSALSSAQDFSRTTAGLAAAVTQANAATGAVRAFGAAVAATASAGVDFAASPAPRATTVQQIAQTPVSVAARQAPAAVIDNRGAVAASAAMDKLAGQTGKAEAAAERLTATAREQGSILGSVVAANAERASTAVNGLALAAAATGAATGITATSAALDSAAVKANAAAAAVGNMQAAAARAANGAQFNPFSGVGGAATAAAKGVGQLGQTQKLTAYQAQQLSFQLNDLFVQMASGQSPIIALIQQGSQLNGTFGGIGGTMSALRSLITPTSVAIGGAAVSVGGLAYAYMQGAAQSKAFNDAITLSGNYAGQTQGQVNKLATTVAESTQTSVGSVREFTNALISTGQIGPQAMALATEAVVRYGEATSKTAQESAADFVKMARDPAKFARELNQSWNAWTSTELDAIETMQKGDKAGKAQVAVLQKMIEHLQGLNKNLGDVDRVGRSFSKMLGDLKDGFFAIGRDRTLEDRLQKLQGIFDRTDTSGFLNKINEALGVGAEKRQNFFAGGNAKEQQATLLAQQEKERKDAEEKAAKAERTKQSEAGGKVLKGYLDRAKPEELFKEREAELKRSIAARRADGVTVSAEEEKTAFAQLKKDFAKPKGPANNEAGQILREQLGEDLSAFKIALAAEKEALAFHQREMQGVYQAGGISLKAFFDDKRATIADGVAAESAALDKEIARLKEYQAAIKDPSEKIRVGKQIGQVEAEKAKVQTAGERDTKLTNQEEAASFKALNDQIVNYNANLLQMAGDELGAARLRAQVTIDNARILAAQGAKDAAGNPVNVDVSALQRAIAISNDFAEAQRQAGNLAQNTARAEEAAYMVAELGGKSLLETENAVYEVRSRAAEQLGELARKARELAEVSTDPKIKQFAADMALQYANAVDKLDPALQRLRGMQRDIASSITGSIDSGIAGFGQNYMQRREQQARDRLQGGKGESATTSALKTINESVILPMAGNITASINKALVTDPLQKYIEAQMKGLTEGDGVIAKFFKDSLGIKDAKVDPKQLAEQAAAQATTTLSNSLTAQTSAVDASTTALNALANAASAAAGASPSRPLAVEAGSRQAAPSMGDFTRTDRALQSAQLPAAADPAASQALADARSAVEVFSATSTDAAVTVTALAQAAGKGNAALGLLPSIINLFQTAVSAMNLSGAAAGASGGGAGIGGAIASLFGSSGGAAAATNASALAPEAADIITSFIFHKGGVVGSSAMSRGTPSSVFAGAPRYHTGGIVGEKADGARSTLAAAALKAGEVPAILMRNEEVLRRDDPRHRENLGSDVFAKVMQSKGENSASVLQGLLTRMGVKDDEPAVSSALKVHGARELGGPVSAGKLYRVNEKRPELLNVGNKQYLMMGSQGGKVDPNPQASGGGQPPVNVTINQSFAPGTDRTTTNQAAAQSGHAARRALTRIS